MRMQPKYHGENRIFENLGKVVVGLQDEEDFEKIFPLLADSRRPCIADHFRHRADYPLWFSVDDTEMTGWMPDSFPEDGIRKPGYIYYLEHCDGYQIFYSVDEMFDAMNGIAQTPIEMVVGFDDIIM